MKLHAWPTSPYVRKVLAMAVETGLREKIALIRTNPGAPDSPIGAANPIGKIPTLITDGGEALYDSRVICEYLDTLHDGPKMFPPNGPERWQALRWAALGDGILDAAVLRMYERRRPEGERSPEWDARQKEKVFRILDRLEKDEMKRFGKGMNIGLITIACALGYLDFRFADEKWRLPRQGIGMWFFTFGKQPLMADTEPVEAI